MSNRKLLAIYFVFWAVFTASYGALRLVKHDQWRWDYLIETYIGMSVAFFIIWGIERTKQDTD